MKFSCAWILVFSIFAVSPSKAADDSVYLGAGGIFQNPLKTTSSDDASTSMFGQLYVPSVSLAARFRLLGIEWMPTVYYTPLAKTEADEVEKKIFAGSLPVLFSSSSRLQFKLGPGVMLYSIGGPGSSVTRNNGGSTATFYLPGTTQTTKLVYLDFGMGLTYPDDWRVDLDILMSGLLSSKRSASIAIQISKGIF